MHFSVWSIYCPRNENYDFVLILRKKNVETADSFRFLARLNICILNGYLIGLVSKCGDVVLKFIYSKKATKFCKISIVELSNVVSVNSAVEIVQNFVAFSEYMNFNLCTSIFWESNWPRIIYLQYCTLLLSPCTELEVIVPMIWEFSLKSRLGVSFRVIISVFCLFFSRPLNAYPMSIFVYNMGIHICIAMHH